MANVVSNELTIVGDEEELKRFRELLANPEEDRLLDYQKVAPIRKHTDDWRADRIAVWGSKWNACAIMGGEIEDKTLQYYFESAWSPVVPVIQVMARKFPKLSFDYRFHECGEDFSGQLFFQNRTLQQKRVGIWGAVPFLRKWGDNRYTVESK